MTIAFSDINPPLRLQRMAETIATNAPGVTLATGIALLALTVSDHTGLPAMLLALFAGLALAQPGWVPAMAGPGTGVSAKTCLRLGIVLLGARISVGDIAGIGLKPFLTVLVLLPATILFGVGIARMMRRGLSYGLLTGGAVAICGASAALAVSTVLPKRADGEERLSGVIAVVTILSTAAMVTYPVILGALGMDDATIGIVLGATIHDVAQVVASGYSVSTEAGDTATVVKLSRVMLLPVVTVVLALALRGSSGTGERAPFPLFILGFLGLAAANSLGLVPQAWGTLLGLISTVLLVSAIAAIGMRTRLATILNFGWVLPLVLLAETLFLAILATLIWV